jgi:hypothetical protein
MAQADSADTTTLPALSRPGNSVVHKLFHMPAVFSTERPPVDRGALMRRAHEIARKFRPQVASYRKALQYGRKGAWGLVATASEFTVPRSRTALLRPNRSPLAARRPTVAGSSPRWHEVHHPAQGRGGALCRRPDPGKAHLDGIDHFACVNRRNCVHFLFERVLTCRDRRIRRLPQAFGRIGLGRAATFPTASVTGAGA